MSASLELWLSGILIGFGLGAWLRGLGKLARWGCSGSRWATDARKEAIWVRRALLGNEKAPEGASARSG